MDNDERGRPQATSRAGERQQRLAAALRENLRRRKAQAQARTQTSAQTQAERAQAGQTQDEERPQPEEQGPAAPDIRDRTDSGD